MLDTLDRDNDCPGQDLIPFDILAVTSLEKDLLRSLVQEHYGLHLQVESAAFPESFSTTSRKAIFAVAGSGPRVFIKEKPLYAVRDGRHVFAASLQNALASRLLFICPIILGQDQRPFFAFKGRLCFLTPYIESSVFSGSIESSVAIAAAVGEMHRVCLDLAPLHGAGMDDVFEWNNMALRELENLSFAHASVAVEFLWRARTLNARLRCYPTMQGPVHGDLSVFNFGFSGPRVVAIHDWDSAGWGSIMQDFAECLVSNCLMFYKGATSKLRLDHDFFFDASRFRRMLGAYRQHCPAMDSDTQYLPQLVTATWLELLLLGVMRGDFSPHRVLQHLGNSDELFTQVQNIVAIKEELHAKFGI